MVDETQIDTAKAEGTTETSKEHFLFHLLDEAKEYLDEDYLESEEEIEKFFAWIAAKHTAAVVAGTVPNQVIETPAPTLEASNTVDSAATQQAAQGTLEPTAGASNITDSNPAPLVPNPNKDHGA